MTVRDDLSPLFVVGVGRSGTTLLQSMLASHPQIESLPETGFLRRHALKRAVTGWHDDARLARLHESLRASVDRDGHADALDAYRALLGHVNLVAGKRYVLDKDPRLIESLSAVFKAFPRARVVHIVRDPRAVLLSKTRAAWSKRRAWWLNLAIGKAQLEWGTRILDRSRRWKVIVIRYEDLVAQPDRELRRICHAFDLDFDRRMLEYEAAAARLTSSDEVAWKSDTQRPLSVEKIDRWRNELSRSRIATVERCLGRTMHAFGYTPERARGSGLIRSRGAACFVFLVALVVRLRISFQSRASVRRVGRS